MNPYIKEKFFGQDVTYISFFTNSNIGHLKELILTANSEINDNYASPSLTSTTSIIELIDDAYHDMLNYKTIIPKPIVQADLFPWVNAFNFSASKTDRYIFKVVTSLLYTYIRPTYLKCEIIKDNILKISLDGGRFTIKQAKISYINQLASIKNYTIVMPDPTIIILSLR
jgi:hypothetical protein